MKYVRIYQEGPTVGTSTKIELDGVDISDAVVEAHIHPLVPLLPATVSLTFLADRLDVVAKLDEQENDS